MKQTTEQLRERLLNENDSDKRKQAYIAWQNSVIARTRALGQSIFDSEESERIALYIEEQRIVYQFVKRQGQKALASGIEKSPQLLKALEENIPINVLVPPSKTTKKASNSRRKSLKGKGKKRKSISKKDKLASLGINLTMEELVAKMKGN